MLDYIFCDELHRDAASRLFVISITSRLRTAFSSF